MNMKVMRSPRRVILQPDKSRCITRSGALRIGDSSVELTTASRLAWLWSHVMTEALIGTERSRAMDSTSSLRRYNQNIDYISSVLSSSNGEQHILRIPGLGKIAAIVAVTRRTTPRQPSKRNRTTSCHLQDRGNVRRNSLRIGRWVPWQDE